MAHFAATRAWSVPSASRLPKMGTPGMAGRFAILGMSVASDSLTRTKRAAIAAIPTSWYDISGTTREVDDKSGKTKVCDDIVDYGWDECY